MMIMMIMMNMMIMMMIMMMMTMMMICLITFSLKVSPLNTVVTEGAVMVGIPANYLVLSHCKFNVKSDGLIQMPF